MAGFSKISVREARSAFAETVRRASKGERVVVFSHDKPKAALVSIADLKRLRYLERILAEHPADSHAPNAETIEAIRQSEAGLGVTTCRDSDDLFAQLGL